MRLPYLATVCQDYLLKNLLQISPPFFDITLKSAIFEQNNKSNNDSINSGKLLMLEKSFLEGPCRYLSHCQAYILHSTPERLDLWPFPLKKAWFLKIL